MTVSFFFRTIEEISGEEALIIMDETQKMLHINLSRGEVGRYAIVPGDPDRCELIAAHLDHPRLVTRKREFTTWEGTL